MRLASLLAVTALLAVVRADDTETPRPYGRFMSSSQLAHFDPKYAADGVTVGSPSGAGADHSGGAVGSLSVPPLEPARSGGRFVDLVAAAASRAEAAADAPHEWAAELAELHAGTNAQAHVRAHAHTRSSADTEAAAAAAVASPATAGALAYANALRRPEMGAPKYTVADVADNALAAAAAPPEHDDPNDPTRVNAKGGSALPFVPPAMRDILQREYSRRGFGDVFKVNCDCQTAPTPDGTMRYDTEQPQPKWPPSPPPRDITPAPLESLRTEIQNVFLQLDTDSVPDTDSDGATAAHAIPRRLARSTDELVADFHALIGGSAGAAAPSEPAVARGRRSGVRIN